MADEPVPEELVPVEPVGVEPVGELPVAEEPVPLPELINPFWVNQLDTSWVIPWASWSTPVGCDEPDPPCPDPLPCPEPVSWLESP